MHLHGSKRGEDAVPQRLTENASGIFNLFLTT